MIIIKDFTSKISLPYKLFLYLSGILILTAFLFNSPNEILLGLKNIILSPDILITDYMAVGGIGATLLNCALLIITYVFLMLALDIKPSGTIIAGIFTVAGFSLFGKNIFNIWPIIFGVWLYSRVQKEPFSKYIVTAIFGTTLSPAFVQLISSGYLSGFLSILLGFIISSIIGFILPPIASACIRLHQGYNLYNVGLAAGLIGTILMSILRSLGINFETRLQWLTGYNVEFTILFSVIFISMIILGFYLNDKSFNGMYKFKKCSGKLITDFYLLFGEGPTLINMGMLGLFSLYLIVFVNGDLNGPTIGGILTIVGFGAFGKHLRNIIPIMTGIILCTMINVFELTSPGVILSLLFSTTLAPIAGSFGPIWGIIAGMIHAMIVMHTSYLHGGMILYNNGFAGGIVCMFLVPLITAFRKEF